MKAYKKPSFAGSIRKYSPKPTFELTNDQICKLKTYGQVLLAVLAVAGVLTVASVAPGAMGALKVFQRVKLRKRLSYKERTLKIAKTFYYLRKSGHVKTVYDKGQYKIALTKKGMAKVQGVKYGSLSISKPVKWDGKFWQVAADIPTKYRSGADAFRRKTKELNLFPLQRTLWFYPFDPRKEIELVAQTCGISSFVTVMRVDKLDPGDRKVIKKHFQKSGLI